MIEEKLKALNQEKYKLERQISNIDQEIYQIRKECQHPTDKQIVVYSKQLEPRYNYDAYEEFDKNGTRIIETRNVKCSICDNLETQLRFTDEEWMNGQEWERLKRLQNRNSAEGF